MNARWHEFWMSRNPRDRVVAIALIAIAAVGSYAALVHAATKARSALTPAVAALREQAARFESHAAELERLRKQTPPVPSQGSLRSLVQAQLDAAGLSRAITRLDAPDSNQVLLTLGALSFADWISVAAGLRAQHVRIEACRVEALSSRGMVSVTATLVRTSRR